MIGGTRWGRGRAAGRPGQARASTVQECGPSGTPLAFPTQAGPVPWPCCAPPAPLNTTEVAP